MDCDGLKKVLITDKDGSFFGRKSVAFSESEFEWDGDPVRGLGDYRIPVAMLTDEDGVRIQVADKCPNKGVSQSNLLAWSQVGDDLPMHGIK